MKVTIERTALLKALGHVHRIVERRNTIPILSNVLIEARDGQLTLKSDRSRSRSDRIGARRRRAGRRDHRSRPCHLRHRPQTARGRAGWPRDDRRSRPVAAALGPRALLPAMPAGLRLSRSDGGRISASLHAARARTEAADRQYAIRDLDRRDALLSQRHLPPHGRGRRRDDAARGRDRRPSARARRTPAPQGAAGMPGRDRAAQGGRPKC